MTINQKSKTAGVDENVEKVEPWWECKLIQPQ